MRIYIDGLFYKGSGIGRYYSSIVKELAMRGFQIYTAVPKNLREDFVFEFSSYPNINAFFVDYQRFSPKGLLINSFLVFKLQKEVAIFFWPHVNLPLYVPEKTVITVHDLRPLFKHWDRNEVKRKVFLYMLKRALKKAKKVICISKSVCEDLEKFDNSVKHKLRLIYNFVDSKLFEKVETKEDRLVKEPYILFVGNRKTHKNLANLLRAFHKIKTRVNHRLVIAGGKDNTFDDVDKLIKELGLEKYVIEYISPSDEVIVNLYKNADLFILPSFFEGFGLPPLEAVSLGCPVILSDISVLREIFEDSSLYFDPNNPEDMAQKIVKMLEDRELRKRLLISQKDRLKLFDRDTLIEKYTSLFKEVVNG